jgi:hypothetical protein
MHTQFSSKNPKGTDRLENLCRIEENFKTYLIMKGYENMNWSHLAQVGIQLEGICEHGNEPSVSIKDREFIDLRI